ncbi:MAG: acyl-CoA thioesterase domain-containing protein [Pseudomonadota bacterium]
MTISIGHSKGFQNAVDLLTVRRDGTERYVGASAKTPWQRLYGGQIIGQAIMAAANSLSDRWRPSALHLNFLQPGSPKEDVTYQVTPLKKGKTLSVIRVDATQLRGLIATATVSFHTGDGGGFDSQQLVPEMPSRIAMAKQDLLSFAPLAIQRYWLPDPPLELVPVSVDRYRTGKAQKADQSYWLRFKGEIDPEADVPAIHCALIAYASDMTLLDTALAAHGQTIFSDSISGSSLDHAMWFHRAIRTGEWYLYIQDAPSAANGRAFTRGRFYTEAGTLVCSVSQEGIIRPRS